jgi:hypothetical protein
MKVADNSEQVWYCTVSALHLVLDVHSAHPLSSTAQRLENDGETAAIFAFSPSACTALPITIASEAIPLFIQHPKYVSLYLGIYINVA